MKKYLSYLLPVITAPSVVLLVGERLHDALKLNDVLTLILALLVAAALCSCIYAWQKAYSRNLIFGISKKYLLGVRRTSIVLGMIISFPVALHVWELLDVPKYVSTIPYLLIWPGVGVVSFIFSCSAICAFFWCIDGFISNE